MAQDATAQRSERQAPHSEHHSAGRLADDAEDDDTDNGEEEDYDNDRYERDDDDREEAQRDDDRRGDRYTSQYGNDRTRSSRDYGRDRNPEIATDRNPDDQRRSRMTERQSLSRSNESSGVDRDFDQDNNDSPHSATRTHRQNRFDDTESQRQEEAYQSRTHGPRSDRWARFRSDRSHDYSDGMWQRASNSRDRNPASRYQEDEGSERQSDEWLESMAERSESETVGEHNERFASNADEFIRQNDEDEDTYLSRDEMPQGMLENFHDLDRDGDNYVGRGELQQHGRNMTQWMRAAHDTASQNRGNDGATGSRVVPVEVTYVWIMDTDSGTVRLNDLQGAYDLLQRLDANNDGNITRSELRDRKQQVVSRWIEHGFNRLDENEDDAISRSEANQTMLQERFDRLDLDGDEELTRSELRRTAENASRWWGPQDDDAYLSEGQGDDQRR